MRTIVKKLFWAWDFEKEEQWLNEMAAKGFALVDYSLFRYSFEDCEPGEYTFKIQLLENHVNHPESQSYIRFMEETGAEQVASYARWVYFRKKNDGAPFEIFSDFGSVIKHLVSVRNFIGLLGLANLLIAISNTINFAVNAAGFLPLVLLNYFMAAAVGFGCFKLQKKISALKKEQNIRE